jgi:hypothetical protein
LIILFRIGSKRIERAIYKVEQELFTLPEHLGSHAGFSGVRVTQSLVLYACFVDRCLSLLYFFIWPLCCLSFFDIRILIVPLVSSSSSYACLYIYNKIELYSFHNIVLKQCTIFSTLSVLNKKKMAGNLTTYNIFSIVLIILIGYFSSSFYLSSSI